MTKDGRTIEFVAAGSAAAKITETNPDTVVLEYSADKNVYSINSTFSPSNNLAWQGCLLGAAWTAAGFQYMFDGVYTGAGGETAYLGLCGLLNAGFIYNTFFRAQERALKSTMAACKQTQADVIFGGWLDEDWEEREVRAAMGRDYLGLTQKPLSELNSLQRLQTFMEFNLMPRDQKKRAEAGLNDPVTYREAILYKRMEVFAYTLNHTPGDKIVAVLRGNGDFTPEQQIKIISSRLTGEVEMKDPLEYNNGRVSVVF